MRTKTKIILKAIELFNQEGFANVKLKQISDELGMSLGNFTYHFPKKDDLTLAVYLYLVKELQSLWETIEIQPNLGHIDAQLHFFHRVQAQFAFFYIDTLEIFRAYPTIIDKHREHIESQIEKIKLGFTMNAKAGHFQDILNAADLDLLADTIWQVLIFWATKNAIRGIKSDKPDDLAQNIWLILRPYLTDKGKERFKELGYSF